MKGDSKVKLIFFFLVLENNFEVVKVLVFIGKVWDSGRKIFIVGLVIIFLCE